MTIPTPAALALALALNSTPHVSGPSLLPNGGFESDGQWNGAAPKDWGDCDGTFSRSNSQPHSGAWCGEVRAVRARYMAAARRIDLSPAQPALLRAWVRTALVPGESAYLAASFSKQGRFSHVVTSRRLAGQRPWTQIDLLLPPSSRKGADDLLVSFRVESTTGKGLAWVDDVELLPVTLPPTPSRAAQEQVRQLHLARAFLVEREFWTDHLASLQARRRDLESLLAEPDAGSWHPRPHPARDRATLEAAVPDDPSTLRARLDQLADLPRLKTRCLTELDAILPLKRRLDGTPEKRRAWLRAQLPGPRAPRPTAPARPLDPALAEALSQPRPPASGDLGEVCTRAGWSPAAWVRSTVQIPAPLPDDELVTALLAPDGTALGWAIHPARSESNTVELVDLDVTAWSPEHPALYDWVVALRRNAHIVDLRRGTVAFRDLAVAPGDLTATMRHAWGWAPDDWSFRLNGQPWFPRGTVLNDLQRHPDEGVALLKELGLEFYRNYGYQPSNIGGRIGERFRSAGLSLLAGIGPSYAEVSSFESRKGGFASFRDALRQDRALLHDPAVLAVQVGNEAELAVWGANLGTSYGEDLWQPFEEAIAIVREEAAPSVPMSYVRAGGYRTVAPVPAEDYSGINQYAGRYWGSRRTIAADLGALGFHAAAAAKPYAITEWFGPKYSWATSGISGIDEDGAARYLVDYQQAMERAPGSVLSTQFVLNWVVTPVEDLTTSPYVEARKQRERWTWSLQQGTPWYPHVFPDLLTDTPARRQLRGMNSPLHDLVETPGPILVSGPEADADSCATLLRALGRAADTVAPDRLAHPSDTRASILLLCPAAEPAAWLETFDLDTSPAPGRFILRRRLLPADPDRLVIILRAGDQDGYRAGLDRLRGDGDGLLEAYARRASCRRLLALVDSDSSSIERYVTDTVMRGWFVARDDLRLRLDPDEILTGDGTLQPAFADLALLLVAGRRSLAPAESDTLRALARLGVEVVWSAPALAANPQPTVTLGKPQALTGKIPVAPWADQPLPTRDLGNIRAETLTRFGAFSPDSKGYTAATTALAIRATGEVAASADGQPVAVRQPMGEGAFWYFGADLVALADALTRTTQRGVNHGLYDRDTACGLERWFRLLTNAGARRVTPRPAARPRLRCDVQLDHILAHQDRSLGVTVVVRDQNGIPADAHVRARITPQTSSHFTWSHGDSTPAWHTLKRLATGRYRLELAADQMPAAQSGISILDSRLLAVYISAEAPGHVGDWTVATLAAARDDTEARRIDRLTEEIRQGLVRIPFGVNDRSQYVEIDGVLTVQLPLRAGAPATLRLTVRQIESDESNDAMEEVALLLRPPSGPTLTLPLAPGKVLCGPKQAAVKSRPQDALIVTSEHPFEVDVPWTNPASGPWNVGLHYRYTDDYRPQIRRVERIDWLPAPTLEVP